MTESPLLNTQPPSRNLFQRALRALLELDRPVPDLSEDELAAQAERDYAWNFTVNVADGALFLFGSAFVASSTILPLFLSKLTGNPLAFGLLAVIAQSGWFLPQLFTANWMERLSRKKPVVVNVGLFTERLPILLLPVIALLAVIAQSGWFLPQLFTANWMERLSRKKPVIVNLGLFTERLPILLLPVIALLAARAPAAAVALLLIVYAWHSFGAGIVAVSWQDLIARCFPAHRRGRYAGTSAFLGAASGFGGSLLATWLLKEYAFPLNFTLVFALGAAGIILSWVFLAFTREPVQAANAPRRSSAEYLRGLPELLRADKNYLRFLVARMLMALGGMSTGFITVSAVQRFRVPDSTAGIYTLAMLGGQAAANLLFGFLSDRHGHKICLEIGALASLLAFAMAWLAPHPAFYVAVFALYGITTGSTIISGVMIAMEFSGPERRPTYMGVANTAVGVAAAVAPLIGAGLAAAGYSLLFAVAAATMLASLAMFRFAVREPRAKSVPAATGR